MIKTKKKALVQNGEELTNAALKLLRSKELLPLYLDAVARVGLVGEESNALVVFTTGVSRLLSRPLNLLVKGQSSSGKNHLVNCCLKTFPPDAVRELTSSTEAAWNYAADEFCHHILYVQERNSSSGAVRPVRLLLSEGKLIRIVSGYENGVRKPKRYVTKGPIASISTTTKDQLEVDDETRHISIWVDESEAQTTRVAVAAAQNLQRISTRELSIWHEVHHLLEKRRDARIMLPTWFTKVAGRVYAKDVRVRRYFPAFTTACRTIALLRSFQHYPAMAFKQQGYIEVAFEDYAIAAIIFEPVFTESLHRGDDETIATRAAIDKMSKQNRGKGVDAKQLAEELSISKDQAYQRVREAAEHGTIHRSNTRSKGNLKLYLPSRLPRFLPRAEDVFRDMPEIGESFDFYHPITGERVAGHR